MMDFFPYLYSHNRSGFPFYPMSSLTFSVFPIVPQERLRKGTPLLRFYVSTVSCLLGADVPCVFLSGCQRVPSEGRSPRSAGLPQAVFTPFLYSINDLHHFHCAECCERLFSLLDLSELSPFWFSPPLFFQTPLVSFLELDPILLLFPLFKFSGLRDP